jgi:two-component system phosphate regulon sensor histidine kinase PhoR
MGENFVYLAKAFDFHGKQYVLRTAFPYKYVVQMTNDFEKGFFAVSSAALLLFGLLTWWMINLLTTPINKIIEAVRPYQEGLVNTIPTVQTLRMDDKDEFGKLAQTLNSLSEKIQKQIDSLTFEKNEKAATLEALIEGVVAVDDKMVITYANQTAERFLGKDNLVGITFDSSIDPFCEELLRQCQEDHQILNGTLKLKKDRGKFLYNVVTVPKDDRSGAVLVLQDQTALFKMLEMKKDFIANASHELKTPITIVRGFAETLHDNPDLPVEVRGDVTEKIMRNCVRMTSLIKDLLTLSDVENIPESRLIECDIIAVVQNCANLLRDAFPTAIIVIEHPEGAEYHIKADPTLMEMAFLNLIENGIKYSKPPAQVTITFEAITPHKLLIKVSDKGIGIPEVDIEHIFERFYTVDKAHSQKMGGSGLGLSIVENIIIKHRGTIRLESKMGEGTTFFIQFPM